jgi:DNA-binding GntR family transcriptional regulator
MSEGAKMQTAVAEDQAYNAIKEMIVKAELKPGARLVHRKLAKQLGISPVPVVLALRLLERDGLVVNMPGLGAYVRTWSRDEIVDLYHIRAAQESLAASMCAERATRVDLAAILDARDHYQQAVKQDDFETIAQADTAFHMSMVRGAHCAYLETMIHNLSIVNLSINMSRYYLTGQEITSSKNPIWLHIPIVKALEKRDPKADAAAAREHIELSMELRLKSLDENTGAAKTTKTAMA